MKKKNVQAFTLLELVIAVGIMLTVIAGLFVASLNCMFLNQTNSNLVIAANDAQYVLEQLKGLAYTDIEDYSPPVFTNLENENIPAPAVTQIKAGLKEVTVNVNWTERQRPRTFSLSTRFED